MTGIRDDDVSLYRMIEVECLEQLVVGVQGELNVKGANNFEKPIKLPNPRL